MFEENIILLTGESTLVTRYLIWRIDVKILLISYSFQITLLSCFLLTKMMCTMEKIKSSWRECAKSLMYHVLLIPKLQKKNERKSTTTDSRHLRWKEIAWWPRDTWPRIVVWDMNNDNNHNHNNHNHMALFSYSFMALYNDYTNVKTKTG